MYLEAECKDCLYNSQLKKVLREQGGGEKTELFKNGVKELCANPPDYYCAPLLMRDIDRLHRKIFGNGIDYSKEKELFNLKLLEIEEELFSCVNASSDPLAEALKFSMAANYIDFARISDLDENAVDYVIKAARRAEPDICALEKFKNKLKSAKSLCFLHDNCGEIVLDKILIRTIIKLYPAIFVTSVVRGYAIINDVTRADAEQVGLGGYAEITDNGSDVPGTYLEEVSPQTKGLLASADVIVSKGLGNLETLYGAGYSVFYCFTCKCRHIAERFGVPMWSAAFVYEAAEKREEKSK